MARQLEFFYDYGSPFSYLADTQLPELAKRSGAQVMYRPMLLGAVFKATGNASPAAIPAKRTYLGAELARWSEQYAITFKMNPHFPINTIRLMRGAVAAQAQGRFDAYHKAAFAGVWAQQLNLGDDGVLAQLLSDAAVDAASLESAETKDKLRAITDEAIRRGVFGAPTFFVGDAMFWGNDRLKWVEQALMRT
ncbi:MAG: 2-hydroxychromene-2-carboxylate isomerase [Candidatus Binataceae bacterium]